MFSKQNKITKLRFDACEHDSVKHRSETQLFTESRHVVSTTK